MIVDSRTDYGVPADFKYGCGQKQNNRGNALQGGGHDSELQVSGIGDSRRQYAMRSPVAGLQTPASVSRYPAAI